MHRALGSDKIKILDVVDPQSGATPSAYSTAWIPAAAFEQFVAIVCVGALTATSTIDAKLEQATSVGGGSAKDVSGKAITQLTQAGSDDDKQCIINLRAEELDLALAFTHVRLTIDVETAAALICGLLLGIEPRYQPEDQAATVDEIVT